jgi:hypothetical protein
VPARATARAGWRLATGSCGMPPRIARDRHRKPARPPGGPQGARILPGAAAGTRPTATSKAPPAPSARAPRCNMTRPPPRPRRPPGPAPRVVTMIVCAATRPRPLPRGPACAHAAPSRRAASAHLAPARRARGGGGGGQAARSCSELDPSAGHSVRTPRHPKGQIAQSLHAWSRRK